MADKQISQLVAATTINDEDLFVMQQGGTAKKLSGQKLADFVYQSAADQIERVDEAVEQAQAAVDSLEEQKNAIAQTIADMAEFGTDTTLTTPAMAADAAVTGEKIGDAEAAALANLEQKSAMAGSIVSFNDGADNVPVKSLKLNVTPVQEGTGTPSTTNVRPIITWENALITRAGKNLIDDTKRYKFGENIIYIGSTTDNYTIHLKAGTYTFSAEFLNGVHYSANYREVNDSGNRTIWSSSSSKTSETFVIANDGVYRFWLCIGTGISMQNIGKCQLELGSEATAYESGKDISQYTIALPTDLGDMPASGTLDVINGTFVIDHMCYSPDPNKRAPTVGDIGDGWVRLAYSVAANAPSHQPINTTNGAYSHGVLLNNYNDKSDHVLYATGSKVIYVFLQCEATESAVQTYISSQIQAGTPLRMTYEIDPITVQLTPVQVKTLLEENRIWANTGNITELVYYKKPDSSASAQAIEAMIAGVEETDEATDNYTVGKIVIVQGILCEVTSAIAEGESFILGTNCKITTVEEQIDKVKNDVTQLYLDVDGLDSRLDTVEDLVESIPPENCSFFEATSHNLFNPANATAAFYYSPGSSAIKTATPSTASMLSGLIPVKEGESYTISGTAITNVSHSGYFDEEAEVKDGQHPCASITFFDPPTGSGKCFTVPENQNIKYVAFGLSKDTTTQQLNGTFQMEVGEVATPIVPYHLEYKIEEQYLPSGSGGSSTGFSEIDRLPIPSYSHKYGQIKNFMNHFMAKDKDLMIVGTGTSLTARSSEHCTTRTDATSRPPLLHSNNFSSQIWDRIKWAGQEYRRFDYPSFFTETGTWYSSTELNNWDDAGYRYGITRYSDTAASVSFEVPEGAWQFNFIYRSDSSGTSAATISITEGNGKMEVWNGSAWVEANGYSFSMVETPVVLTNIQVCDPTSSDNSKESKDSYQVGGNTTYQKRLKMRCKSGLIDSRESSKTVTISSSSGRLMYWGVEWSTREFMITYINSARGSHSMSVNPDTSLYHFQDNEIWSFKPDLIFTENPVHNSGGAAAGFTYYYTQYWGYLTNDFFFNAENPISLVSRADANGIDPDDLEWIIFTSSIAWNFGGIDDNGELKTVQDRSGRVLTALDAQTLCHKWIEDNMANADNIISINACKYWCDAGVKLFGDLKTATQGSDKNGLTFTDEGSHWNDTGGKVMDRCIGSVFDFYN